MSFGGLVAFKRFRVQLTAAMTLLSVGWGSKVVAETSTGSVPSATDLLGPAIALAVSLLGLFNSWVKRKERTDHEKLEEARAAIPKSVLDDVQSLKVSQLGTNQRIMSIEERVDELGDNIRRDIDLMRSSVELSTSRAVSELSMVAHGLERVARTIAERDRVVVSRRQDGGLEQLVTEE